MLIIFSFSFLQKIYSKKEKSFLSSSYENFPCLSKEYLWKPKHLLTDFFERLLFLYYLKILCLTTFQDTQCGFKLLNRSKFIKIVDKLSINGFGFDVELLFLAERKRLTITEVPVTWVYGEESRVKPLQHSLEMIKDAIMIRWRYWVGAYK